VTLFGASHLARLRAALVRVLLVLAATGAGVLLAASAAGAQEASGEAPTAAVVAAQTGEAPAPASEPAPAEPAPAPAPAPDPAPAPAPARPGPGPGPAPAPAPAPSTTTAQAPAPALAPTAAASQPLPPPAAPSYTSRPPDSASSAPSWAWSVDDSTIRVDCRLVQLSTGTTVAAVTGCGLTYTANLSAWPGGSYELRLTAYNVEGTASTTTANDSVLYSATGPFAPTITSGPASPGNGTSVSWTFALNDGNSPTCTLTAPNGTVVSTVVNCSTTMTYTLTSGDGTYTFRVQAQNGNATPATSVYVLDTVPPTVGITPPPSPHATTSPTFTITGGETGASYSCTLTHPNGTTTTVTPCAPGSVTVGPLGVDGTYTLTLVATDAAGNPRTVTAQYVLDRSPLAAPTVTGPSGPSSNRSPSYTLTTSESGVSWSCTVTGPRSTARWGARRAPGSST
jgi:hypothetical protein